MARIGRPPVPAIDRFFAKVQKTATCWLWTAQKSKEGYGRFFDGSYVEGTNRNYIAYRWFYEYTYGELPDEIELDHLCRNPACVRLDHLEPVTRRVNTLRSLNPMAMKARQLFCIRGHALSGENVRIRKSDGHRQCRTCERERNRRKNKTEARKEWNRQWLKSEHRKAWKRAWNERNREKMRTYSREYWRANYRKSPGSPLRRYLPSIASSL